MRESGFFNLTQKTNRLNIAVCLGSNQWSHTNVLNISHPAVGCLQSLCTQTRDKLQLSTPQALTLRYRNEPSGLCVALELLTDHSSTASLIAYVKMWRGRRRHDPSTPKCN